VAFPCLVRAWPSSMGACTSARAPPADPALRKLELEGYKKGDGELTVLEDGDGTIGNLLRVEIFSASNVRNIVDGAKVKSSPFVKMDIGLHYPLETQKCRRNLNPEFNQTFKVVDYVPGTPIKFEMCHPAVKKLPEISLGTGMLRAELFKDDFNGTINLRDPGNENPERLTVLKVKVDWVDASSSLTKEMPSKFWIVRYRPIGLRTGPGIQATRVHVDLQPGEEFGVVEVVKGVNGQEYIRLADGRGWAFTKSPGTGDLLAEPLEAEPVENNDW